MYRQQDHPRLQWMDSKVFELNKLLYELDGQGGYFIDFISTRGIEAGIIRLHAGEIDS
jgi:hypothetical protein